MKKVACYIRVSTQEQVNEGYSIGAQKDRLIAYCKAKDWIVADMFVDGGFSGSSLERPAMQKMISEIKKFDIVLVYKLDRISRSQRDMLYLIEEVFLPNGVDFVSMNESFDTSTPFGRAMIGILSVFAQLEREQIKERSLMGRIERAKAGLYHGGPYDPIGYDQTKEGKLIINEYEAMQVRKVYELYLSGMGTDRIATFMNSSGYKYKTGNWSYTSSVTSVLSNIVYLGHIKFKAMVIENAHDPIITKELWDQVKSTREERHKKFGSSFKRGEMLLSGFLRCGVCGSRFYSHSVNKITQYYSCYSVGKSNSKMSKSTSCKAKRWRVEILEAMVDYEIRLLCFDNSYFDKLLKTSKPRNKSVDSNKKYIDTRIIEIDKQINKLMDLYQSDTIPMDVVSSRIDTLHQEKLLLVDQLKSLPTENDEENLTDGVAELLSNTSTLWDMADLEQKRFLLSALIRQIVVFDDHIEIDWTFLPEREKATD